jgi:hypothetical protein
MAVPKKLGELAYAVAVELKAVREGTITTGTLKNGFTDTFRTETNDYWNKGTFFVLSHALDAAPFGEVREVTDFVTGAAITLKSDLSANITAGDRYAISRRRYPYDVIVQHINSACRDLGQLPSSDVSIVTTQNATQYTIPDVACKDLREVYLQTSDTFASVKGWYKIPRGEWRQEGNILYVPQYSEDYTVKLVYVGEPTMLTAETDEISEFVHPNRIIYKAAAGVLMWRSDRLTATSVISAINQRVNYFLDMDQKASYRFPIVLPKRDNKLFIVSFTGDRDYDDVVTPPGLVHLG